VAAGAPPVAKDGGDVTGLRYGYVTNGLVHHSIDDALGLLAENGYRGVALTLGHVHFDPFAPLPETRARDLRRRLESLGLSCAVETGAPFLLDPRRKHFPSLVSEGRERRIELLCRTVDIAAELGAGVVSIWSGAAPRDVPLAELGDRLADGCMQVLRYAQGSGVVIALEPEPGMLVERLDDFERLRRRLGDPEELGLTLDLGHVVCVERMSAAQAIHRGAATLAHVHIEDMRRGVHEHLMFGDGELDVGESLTALHDVGYAGIVAVELSRHAHVAPEVVQQAIETLRQCEVEPLAV
jgi:sugar phosphate isomerase/epimerase